MFTFNRLSMLLVVSLFTSACGSGLGQPKVELSNRGVKLQRINSTWFFVSPLTVELPSNAVGYRLLVSVKEVSYTAFLRGTGSRIELTSTPTELRVPLDARADLPPSLIELEVTATAVVWDGFAETTQSVAQRKFDFDNR